MGKRGVSAGVVAKGAKVFPVGKLLRRAKGLRTKADEAVTAGRRGVSPPTRPRRHGQAKNWRDARAARDRAHDRATTVTGATDPETGITRTGHNGPGDDDGWGCAERYALEEINKARAEMVPPKGPLKPNEVDYSEALDIGEVGDRVQKPVDGACQRRTDPEQFPNDTQYYPNDQSNRGGGWAQRYGIPF